MATVQPFYLEQIQSNYWGLENLMHHSEAIKDIETLSKNQKFVERPSKDTPYFNRWRIVWITIAHPFYSISSIFCSSVSLMAYFLYLPKIARVFTVLSKQMTRDWEQLCGQWEFKSSLLTPSINIHQFSTWDVYQHGDVSYNSISDEMIRSLTYQNTSFQNAVKRAINAFYERLEESRYQQSWVAWLYNRGQTVSADERRVTTEEFLKNYQSSTEKAIAVLREKYSWDKVDEPIHALYGKLKEGEEVLKTIPSLSLFSNRGSCVGGSLWFIFLYHKTRHLFMDPKKHLMAVANQFVAGMPRQAALLQALHESEDLLKLSKTELPQSTVSTYEMDHNLQSAKEKIASLPEGIYRVGTYKHSLVYVKCSEDKQYVWNPEFGLFPMKGEEMLYDMILKHHYKPGDPESIIYFNKYDNLDHFEQESA